LTSQPTQAGRSCDRGCPSAKTRSHTKQWALSSVAKESKFLYPTQKGCLTARQELSRQRVGLASPDNSDTHDSNGGRHVRRTVHRRGKLHIGGIGGGPEPADIEGGSSRSHGPAAERPALGLGEPESTHHWTETTCRAAPLACSDWSKERDVGRSHGWIGSKAVERTGSWVGRAAIQG
jgi:hypothetical protein